MKKTIWITGAGSGIGEAITRTYAENGNLLIISGRNQEPLEKLKEDLKNSDCQVQPIVLDVSNEDEIQKVVNKVLSDHGHVDTLINNAGISQRSLIQDTNNEVGRKIMEVNFFGTVHLTKALLPSMLERNSGSIVVISSGKYYIKINDRQLLQQVKSAFSGHFNV